MRNIFGVIACVAVSGMCASACHGFDPTDPFSTAPLDRAIAKVGNSDCETTREDIQKQVKNSREKGSTTPAAGGVAWLCRPAGRPEVEVWHLSDTGKTVDGLLESWDDESAQQRHDQPGASQQFLGAHDGDSLVFYSEDPSVDFSARLTPSGAGLQGKLAVRNGSSCLVSGYSCSRL